MLMSHVNGCHGNHAFFIVQMCLSLRKNALHFGVPYERLEIHEKIVLWVSKLVKLAHRVC